MGIERASSVGIEKASLVGIASRASSVGIERASSVGRSLLGPGPLTNRRMSVASRALATIGARTEDE